MLALIGCSTPASVDGGLDARMDAAATDAAALRDAGADAGARAPLEVIALGVQGFVLRYRGESVLTAPLFTRQSIVEIGLNLPMRPDVAAIEAGLAEADPASIRAIVSGHAHYDHLLDVPPIMTALAPAASLYANRSARHILAALAPDRDAACTSPPPASTIARSRVVAMDDPSDSHVDYRNCADQVPPGAPMIGTPVNVPGSHLRVRAVCTTHPDQIGPIHFGAGSIDADLCDVPAPASGWLEGRTMSFLIDFLEADGATIAYRVYYQDAPATSPVGEVPADLLTEHGVDLAILCVGSNDSVTSQPTDIIASLSPRFVVSGHWEDFFRALDEPLQPIPLLNVDQYVARAEAALAAPPERPLTVDGAEIPGRHVLAMPGTQLSVPPAP